MHPSDTSGLDLILTPRTSSINAGIQADIISLNLMQAGIIPRDSRILARVFATALLARHTKNPIIPHNITFEQAGKLAEYAYDGALSTFKPPVANFQIHSSTDTQDLHHALQANPNIKAEEVKKILGNDLQTLATVSQRLRLPTVEVLNRLNQPISKYSPGRVTVFTNAQEKLAVVAAAGTDFTNFNLHNLYDDIVHIPFGSPGKNLPIRMQSALMNTLKETITPSSPLFGYKVILAGHSLAGTNSSFLGAKYHLPAFAFDPVNTRRITANFTVQPGQIATVIGTENALNQLGPLIGDLHKVGVPPEIQEKINRLDKFSHASDLFFSLNPYMKNIIKLVNEVHRVSLTHPISHIVPQLEGYPTAQISSSSSNAISSAPIPQSTTPDQSKTILFEPLSTQAILSEFISYNQHMGHFSVVDVVYPAAYSSVPTVQNILPQGISGNLGVSNSGIQLTLSTSVLQYVPVLVALPIGLFFLQEFFSSDLQNAQRHYLNAAEGYTLERILDVLYWGKSVQELRQRYIEELRKELKNNIDDPKKYHRTQALLSIVESNLQDSVVAHLHNKRQYPQLQQHYQLYRKEAWEKNMYSFQQALQEKNIKQAEQYLYQLKEIDPFTPQVELLYVDLALSSNNLQQAWSYLKKWAQDNKMIIQPDKPPIFEDNSLENAGLTQAYYQKRLFVSESLLNNSVAEQKKQEYFNEYAQTYKQIHSVDKQKSEVQSYFFTELAKKAQEQQLVDSAFLYARQAYIVNPGWQETSRLSALSIQKNQLQEARKLLEDFIITNQDNIKARRQLVDLNIQEINQIEISTGQSIQTNSDLFQSLLNEMKLICLSSQSTFNDVAYLINLYRYFPESAQIKNTLAIVDSYIKKDKFNYAEVPHLEKIIMSLPNNFQAKSDFYKQLSRNKECPEEIKIKASNAILDTVSKPVSFEQKNAKQEAILKQQDPPLPPAFPSASQSANSWSTLLWRVAAPVGTVIVIATLIKVAPPLGIAILSAKLTEASNQRRDDEAPSPSWSNTKNGP